MRSSKYAPELSHSRGREPYYLTMFPTHNINSWSLLACPLHRCLRLPTARGSQQIFWLLELEAIHMFGNNNSHSMWAEAAHLCCGLLSQMPLYSHPSKSRGLRISIEHQSLRGEHCPLLGASLDLAVLRTCLLVICWVSEQVEKKGSSQLKRNKK